MIQSAFATWGRGASVLALAFATGVVQPARAQTVEGQVPKSSNTRQVITRPADKDGFTFFVDQSGVPTLTNRKYEYRSDPDFVEVSIEFRPIVVPGRYRFGAASQIYRPGDLALLVRRYAHEYGLQENLIYGVIKAESGFDPNAVSKKGARGLMQLMPGTAAEMQVGDIFDPAQNIAGGVQYLARLVELFNGDLTLALAAYNAGPTAVQKYKGVPPFKETKAYVKKVFAYASEFADGPNTIALNTNTRRPAIDFTPARSPFIVHFKSGTTQPADSVRETDTHYILSYARRQDAIRKDLVARVEKIELAD